MVLGLAWLPALIGAQTTSVPGALDTTFNTGGQRPGRVTLDFGTSRNDQGNVVKLHTVGVELRITGLSSCALALIRHPDGGFVAAGYAGADPALVRYDDNGNFMSKTVTPVPGTFNGALASAIAIQDIQGARKLVVAGSTDRGPDGRSDFLIARFDLNCNSRGLS